MKRKPKLSQEARDKMGRRGTTQRRRGCGPGSASFQGVSGFRRILMPVSTSFAEVGRACDRWLREHDPEWRRMKQNGGYA